MKRLPPRSTRTDTPLPYTRLFRPGLAAITTEVKAGTAPGLGQRGEIDECGEVLQARQQVRIGMRAVPVMADQCAIAAFGQIVFTTRIAVVGEQHRALVQQAADRLNPVR